MHPKVHVASSAAVALAYGLWISAEPVQLLLWVVVAAAATLLLDLDHILILLVRRESRPALKEMMGNPRMYMSVDRIRDKIFYPGMGLLRLETHFLITLAASLLMPAYNIPYAQPIALSLWTHFIVDGVEALMQPEKR